MPDEEVSSWHHPSLAQYFREHPDLEPVAKVMGDMFWTSFSGEIREKGARYPYFLLSPRPRTRTGFGIQAEVVALYSPYDHVQQRTVDAILRLLDRHKERVDQLVAVLVSHCDTCAEELAALVGGRQIRQTIVPLAYTELAYTQAEGVSKKDRQWVRDQFQKYLYGRDLFDWDSPIQEDAGFFGRDPLVVRLCAGLREGQNFGVFGLRKAGKTSVLLAVKRKLNPLSASLRYAMVDCESPAVHHRRWWNLLRHLGAAVGADGNPNPEWNENNAAELFSTRVTSTIKSLGSSGRVVLALDEIEHITFGLAGGHSHWDEDYLPFWQTLRGLHTDLGGRFCFLMAGTNARCSEFPLVNDRDNPIFQGISPQYLKPFSVDDVARMVRGIGKYMGLSFDQGVFSYLAQRFGGHPFLIRKACSHLAAATGEERPARISDELCTREDPRLLDALQLIAEGGRSAGAELQKDEPGGLRHLRDYGLVDDAGELRCTAVASFLRVRGGELLIDLCISNGTLRVSV
jgi:uncharacterized protein YuzB (UPF0349 family)